MDKQTLRYYAGNAESLAGRYARAPGELAQRITEAVGSRGRILDVGCGSGRDLAYLLRRGYDAYGVDASREMLSMAAATLQTSGLSGEGRLFEAALPNLNQFQDNEFDGVLCSAVLMHLPEEEIFDAVYALRRVLRAGGSLFVSVPEARDDVDPVTRRDANGRLFADLPPAKLQLLFERIGFSVRQSQTVADSLGRSGIKWNISEFTKLDESADRPLHLVESILNRDKKDATYKLALFRALADIAQTSHHLAAFTPEGKVKIPIDAIAEKWMLYYWPVFESTAFIPQRIGEKRGTSKGVAIRSQLDLLIAHYRGSGGLTGFYTDWKGGRFAPQAEALFRKARSKFQQTIWNMPVKHAGGGEFDVFQYDRSEKSVCMAATLWRELCLTGSWIQDATVLRWAELTEKLSNKAVKTSQVIDCLLAVPDPARNVNDARRYFNSLPDRVCVWSERPLSNDRFAIDHAMPFSLWRNNDLWNLFPTAQNVNSEKRDRLPTYNLLNRRRDTIVEYWRGLDNALGARFEREAQTLLGHDAFDRSNWETRLFSRFVEAFEVTASQRGVERWELDRPAILVTPHSARPKSSPVPYPMAEERMIPGGDGPGHRPITCSPHNIIPFQDVGDGSFKTHLPLVGALAAGAPFHGLETGSLADSAELDWIEVPTNLARKNRFVVRVAGDSMEPTLHVGDLVIFEYHRTPRRDREIVIANLPEFGVGHPGIEAVKRIAQDAENWIFESDNPSYQPIRIAKCDTDHPILGTMVRALG